MTNKTLLSKIEILEKSINQIQKKERDFCAIPRTEQQLKNYKNLVHSNYENEISFDELLQELSNNQNEMYFDEPLRCKILQNE